MYSSYPDSSSSSRILIGTVIDHSSRGEGIVKVDAISQKKTYRVRHSFLHDTVAIQKHSRKSKKPAFSHTVTRSPWNRIAPFCEHYGICGGCSMQEISYKDQRSVKQEVVRNLLSPYLSGPVVNTEAELPMVYGNPYYYRNRIDYSFGARKWLVSLPEEGALIDYRGSGFHVKGFYDRVVHINNCFLTKSNEIRKCVHTWAVTKGVEFYDNRFNSGWLRGMTIRNNYKDECLVVLVVHDERHAHIEELKSILQKNFPMIRAMYVVINDKTNDAVQELPHRLIYGSEYLLERCGHISLKIYPQVFYQTNTELAPQLYRRAVEMAHFQGDETVLDLYCGIGGIGLFVAEHVQKVIAIDEIEFSVRAAQENAALNNITNIEYITGKVEDHIREIRDSVVQVNCVAIVDPPRAGLHPKVVQALLECSFSRIVYISCNPITLARDLALLSKRFKVSTWQTVDMFPHTHHIETIALLTTNENA